LAHAQDGPVGPLPVEDRLPVAAITSPAGPLREKLDEPSRTPRKPAEYYYYDPDGLGAHAFYNPQNFIVQGGLGALYDERVDRFDWAGGFATVNQSLARPVDAVSDYGWGRFFYREFVPHLGAGQNYVPNYVWHFMGGGMRTKLMEEFYRHNTKLSARQARLLAWITMYSYHYLNEAVQAERFKQHERATTDAIADMLFFDWWGGVFFKFDAVNRYLSHTLHMREWSFQAQYDPSHRRLMNNGQMYWMRVHLYSLLSLSFLTGEQITSLNLTFELGGKRQLSMGLGPKSKAFIARKNGDTDPTEIVLSAGLFYSVDDNPFVTLTFEPEDRHGKDYQAKHAADGRYLFNVYPGPVRVLGRPVGFTLAYHREAVFAGVAIGASPAGLALSSR
jgi:hypothetical protein